MEGVGEEKKKSLISNVLIFEHFLEAKKKTTLQSPAKTQYQIPHIINKMIGGGTYTHEQSLYLQATRRHRKLKKNRTLQTYHLHKWV